MELGGTTSTERSQKGPMEPPDPAGPLPLETPVPTDINQKVNQLLHPLQAIMNESGTKMHGLMRVHCI